MTDDFGLPNGESDLAIVSAAIRLAQQISKKLRAGRARRDFDEAERAAILRDAFQTTIGALSHGGCDDPHSDRSIR